jgi:hypothetical protein
MHYHVSQGGVNLGKFSVADIQRKLANGSFSPQDHYWAVGMPGWKPLAEFPSAAGPAAPAAPALQPAAPLQQPTAPRRPQPAPAPYGHPAGPQTQPGAMSTERIQTLGFIGAGLLVLGAFGPVAEIGRLSFTLMQEGTTKGMIILGCGIAGAIFSQIKQFNLTWIPAAITALLLGEICYHIADAPVGNFFGTRITISPGWGLLLMLIGTGFLLASAWNGSKQPKR